LLVVLGAAGAFFAIRALNQTTIVYEPDLTKISSVSRADLDTAVQVLKQRWNLLGHPEMEISVSGNNQIVARTPLQVDAQDIESSKEIGLVEFVDLGESQTIPGTMLRTDLEVSYLPQGDGKAWHTIMTNRELDSSALLTSQTGGVEIEFTLNLTGTKILADFSSKNVGRTLAIVVDKKVIMAPTINSKITEGRGVIAGKFTRDEAQKIAAYLRPQALPFPFK
jgi:preprotein translocase subunit SecD